MQNLSYIYLILFPNMPKVNYINNEELTRVALKSCFIQTHLYNNEREEKYTKGEIEGRQ